MYHVLKEFQQQETQAPKAKSPVIFALLIMIAQAFVLLKNRLMVRVQNKYGVVSQEFGEISANIDVLGITT